MRARTIIRLGSEPDRPVQWLSLDAEGHPQGPVHSGALADAAEATGGRPAIALLPGFDVLLLSARIPTQSRQKQMRALPFVLEDQLAEDVEDLHFVPGAREDGALSVAVIDKARLREWLDACKSAGIALTQIQPETLALPRGADEWTVLIEDASFLVRTGTHAGFAGARANLLPLLEAALAEAEQPPTGLRVFGTAPELDALDIERDIDTA